MASYKSNIISSNKINEGPQCSLSLRKLPSWRLRTEKMLVPDGQRMMTHSRCLEFSYICPQDDCEGRGLNFYLWPTNCGPSGLLRMHNRLLALGSTITQCDQAWPQSSLLLCEKSQLSEKSLNHCFSKCLQYAETLQHYDGGTGDACDSIFWSKPSFQNINIFCPGTGLHHKVENAKEESRNALVHLAYTWAHLQRRPFVIRQD